MGNTRQTIAGSTQGLGTTRNFAVTLLRASWLAILLGLVMQTLVLLTATISGLSTQLGSLVMAVGSGVSWSVLVCVGLTIGIAASEARPSHAGIAGLIAAPVAFAGARVVQQAIGEALDLNVAVSQGNLVLLVSALKGIEYGCLGSC